MKTQQQVLAAYQDGKQSECIDGRDLSRLVDYFPVDQWEVFGFRLTECAESPTPKQWTDESFKESLRGDLAFGIEKAEGQRGLSAGAMYEVVKMWLWILDDPLCDNGDYHGYGLPFFNEVARKYGFPPSIGR